MQIINIREDACLIGTLMAQVPDTDPLLDYILKGEVTGAEAAEALKALPSAFPMKPGVSSASIDHE